MAFDIIIPSPGESITQVQVARWLVSDGEAVEKDQEIVEIDSDKASFPLVSPADGTVKLLVREGDTVAVGAVIATVEPTGEKPVKKEKKVALPQPPPASSPKEKEQKPVVISPLAEKMLNENRLTREEVSLFAGNRRITKKDIEAFIRARSERPVVEKGSRKEERKKLSALRLKLAQRLVAVKNETAMLTTFNEVNMRKVLEIKEKYQEPFRERFGVGLGLVSFFAKAVTLALNDFPQVNSMIDGDELVIPAYMDIGIAVSAPKGLVVPVIRNAESMDIPELEVKIKELAVKARDNRLTLDEMKGGTFTITNGGVFGSMMSTPILNPPQSAILGMHKIMDRPVAVEGKVEIHPMMYLALSYDHRVIDGRESVGFLVKVKEYLEDPAKMLLSGEDPFRLLLDI
jgi:2-oxoglutarate dehydrogenase E2 component (dihydrolipoamide succinyltransferase)